MLERLRKAHRDKLIAYEASFWYADKGLVALVIPLASFAVDLLVPAMIYSKLVLERRVICDYCPSCCHGI